MKPCSPAVRFRNVKAKPRLSHNLCAVMFESSFAVRGDYNLVQTDIELNIEYRRQVSKW